VGTHFAAYFQVVFMSADPRATFTEILYAEEKVVVGGVGLLKTNRVLRSRAVLLWLCRVRNQIMVVSRLRSQFCVGL
jgi:hypothetical protein